MKKIMNYMALLCITGMCLGTIGMICNIDYSARVIAISFTVLIYLMFVYYLLYYEKLD